jgi:oxygen-independent coproporphyrinogen-3 oxidase
MAIMCERRLDFAALSADLGVEVEQAYANELASLADLEADGIVVRTEDGLTVTDAGQPFVRVVAARFDAYLKTGTAAYHSRAV